MGRTARGRIGAILVAAVVAGAGCEAAGGASGGADVPTLTWSPPAPPPCDDGEPCTLEERTPEGCRVTGVAPACEVRRPNCCGWQGEAEWNEESCGALGLESLDAAECGAPPQPALQVCCELLHPDGAFVRLAWTWASCVAADGAPFVPAECVGAASADPVCCAFEREGGTAFRQLTGRVDCADRGGAEVAASECERAAEPVCCTTPALVEGGPERRRILPLAECLAYAGGVGGQETCDSACSEPCDGRRCGPDGCGGWCGTCDGDLVCTARGTCELSATAGETVCCERSAPDGEPRERRLAWRDDCAAAGGAAIPLERCGEERPEPLAGDACCQWPGEGAHCADHADCGDTGLCHDTPFGGLCGGSCLYEHDCPVGQSCRPVGDQGREDPHACRPAALWWPAADCAATGGVIVEGYVCVPVI